MSTIILGAALAMWVRPAPSMQEVATAPKLIGNPAAFFGPDSYPLAARHANETGQVSLKLRVGADGRVTECAVKSPAKPNLDAGTCSIAMAKLTFEPAKDVAGKAVASDYALSVQWELGESFVPTTPIEVSTTVFTPNVVETEIVIDEDGRVASCRLSVGQAGGDVCAAYPVGDKMGPGFRRNGKPVRAILRERREMSTEFLP